MTLDTLDLQYQDINIHLQLFDPVTAIMGPSGCGKSFIVAAISNYIMQNPDCGYRTLTLDNFEQWKAMDVEIDKIWFIDNADLLAFLHPEVIEYINSGCWRIVLFANEFSEFRFDYRAFSRLNFDPSRKILTNELGCLG